LDGIGKDTERKSRGKQTTPNCWGPQCKTVSTTGEDLNNERWVRTSIVHEYQWDVQDNQGAQTRWMLKTHRYPAQDHENSALGNQT
jgi:hypothetical protein